MRHLYFVLATLTVVSAQPTTRHNVAQSFGFENSDAATGKLNARWYSPQGSAADTAVVHSGKFSARIERTATSAGEFTTVTAGIPVDITAKKITWRGWAKTEEVENTISLWIRHDVGGRPAAFDSTQRLGVKGTTDWTQYTAEITPAANEGTLVFGFFLMGSGKAWFDDFELLVDGKPIAEVIKIPTILDIDNEFNSGSSKVTLAGGAISPAQTRRLATLARVWGFVKYHHPVITSGKRHWDYELLRVMPKVLAASTDAEANGALLAWISQLDPIPECEKCATAPAGEVHLTAPIDWLRDTQLLGVPLSEKLRKIHRNRAVTPKQFYVSMFQGIGNPNFENEPSYAAVRSPDPGFQLLALFRYWNMIEYFFPYRDIMADNPNGDSGYWLRALHEFIPRFAQASDSRAYQLEFFQLIAKVNDTHANLWSSTALLPPAGLCEVPVSLRAIEGRPYVFKDLAKDDGSRILKIGDVIDEVAGEPVTKLIAVRKPFYPASNEPTRLRDIYKYLLRGDCGDVQLKIDRDGKPLTVTAKRISSREVGFVPGFHDRPGPEFQKIADDIAYLKLGSVKAGQAANYVKSAEGTKGMIIDIRNYPSAFMVFELGSLLIDKPTDVVNFTTHDVVNPGATTWSAQPFGIYPKEPRYPGKIVILIDEASQSQSEYTTMALRVAPGAIVIGSTTAGADGNVSTIPLPGNFRTMISGLGIFYPDRRPTQRVGIIPDIELKPTLAGMRAGRDELIEEAIRQIRKP